MLKLEDHVELLVVQVRVPLSISRGDIRCLAHRDHLVLAHDVPVHLPQELMHTGTVGHKALDGSVLLVGGLQTIRQASGFGDQVDDVHPETIDPLVSPPVHHLVDCLPNPGIFPVEVRLLRSEEVEIVLVGRRVILPGRTGEV